MDAATLKQAKNYADKLVQGLGALKGANCVIDSIDTIPEGNRVTFSWTGTDGITETSTMIVENGVNGNDGTNGVGVSKIEKINTVGLVDTYRITFTDNTTYDYSVTNGQKGEQGLQGLRGEKGEQGEQGVQGIQGIQGEKGDDGYPFLIYKEYSDVSEFNKNDFPEIGLMFMIVADDATSFPVYRYTGDDSAPYRYVTDLTGGEGIKGEKGDKGEQGEQGVQGENGKDGITYIPTIGTVTSGDIASATVVVDDDTSTAEFSFVLPKGDNITVDTILSNTSENPVQNKVIKQAIDNKADKTTATKDTNGLMSAEDKSKLDDTGNTYALKSKYGDTTINVGRKAGTTVGEYSTAEGHNTTASGEGSHAEGIGTKASGEGSHAEGIATEATGRNSHAEGVGSIASGYNSHAGGGYSQASGMSSFSHGIGTFAYADGEVVFGKYNISRHGTLFSIGDGTADDARHNAFEITTDGGKLHDKDIATTDLIPTTLPANGGNADTVDNLHADDFVNATDFNNYQIPNSTDVPDWIYANGKRYQQYMTNSLNIGTTNIPNDSISWVWYWFDGINIFAREWTTDKYYICDVINGYFSGWKDIYTSGYKPYVTGSVVATSTTITTNHGFQPSAVLYSIASEDYNVRGTLAFDSTSFTALGNISSSGTLVQYIIFK